MSFLTLLQSQGSTTQTVTLNRVESTATVFNPTVVRQASNAITLTLLASTAQVFLPAVVQAGGVQTVTLNRRESTAQVFLPTVVSTSLVTDTSDILDRNLKRHRNDLTAQEEEAIAAQLLKARQSKKRQHQAIKRIIDWKKLFTDKINGVETIEQLEAIAIPSVKDSASEIRKAVIEEILRAKEQKRLEFEIARKEAELKLLEVQERAKTQIRKQQQALKAAKALQMQVLERYNIAMNAAMELERRAFEEARIAEERAAEFTKKRNQKIKRLRSLMWLAGLDI